MVSDDLGGIALSEYNRLVIVFAVREKVGKGRICRVLLLQRHS